MSDDRKKKLEEIKRRKELLQKKLQNQSLSKSTVQTPASNTNLNTQSESGTSSEATSLSASFSVDVSKNPKFFQDPAKNYAINKIQLKKFNASLETTNFEQTLIGIYPPMTDHESQYEIPEDQAEKKRKEEERKAKEKAELERRNSFVRKASVDETQKKTKGEGTTTTNNTTEKQKDNKIYSEEKIQLFSEKNQDILKKFLSKEKQYFEKSLIANDIFDIGETYYDEDEDSNTSHRNVVSHKYELGDLSSQNRVVIGLEWSQHAQDLFMASFNDTNDFFSQQSGLIELWSLTNRKSPDYTINYQTVLTTSIFHPFNPKIILGGTYTGQIVMWDTKSKPIPIQKSPMGIGGSSTSKTHSHPISCLAITGDNNNATIISISSDGVMCEWAASNLSRPIYRTELHKKKLFNKIKFDEISALSLSFNQASPKTFLIGADDYNIYNIATSELENKDNVLSVYKSHLGPVFCVDSYPFNPDATNQHTDLFISCSADWTTRLWSMNHFNEPLITFDQSNDYIYSCKWHPHNPSLFATADGMGKIDFWDINKDKEVPIYTYNLKKVINKISWSHDGKKLAAGDREGKINIFASEKDVFTIKPDDFTKFDKVINGLLENVTIKEAEAAAAVEEKKK